MRRGRVRGVLLAVLVLGSACEPPLRVRRVTPADYYREETRSALSSGDVSDLTRMVLRRHDLLAHYEDEPDSWLRAHTNASKRSRESPASRATRRSAVDPRRTLSWYAKVS